MLLVLTLVSLILSLEVLIINLFICSGFWPTLAVFLQKMPIVGWLFQQPFIRSVILLFHILYFRSYLGMHWFQGLLILLLWFIHLNSRSLKIFKSANKWIYSLSVPFLSHRASWRKPNRILHTILVVFLLLIPVYWPVLLWMNSIVWVRFTSCLGGRSHIISPFTELREP